MEMPRRSGGTAGCDYCMVFRRDTLTRMAQNIAQRAARAGSVSVAPGSPRTGSHRNRVVARAGAEVERYGVNAQERATVRVQRAGRSLLDDDSNAQAVADREVG